jgi:phage baseplate assembly protein V
VIRAVNKLIAPIGRAMRSMVLRGVITLVNDAAALQLVQVQLRAMPQPSGAVGAEMADNLEVLRHYGFTAVPHAGAEAVVLAVNGVKAHGLVIAIDDRRYRLSGLQGGEVALYDDLGNVVKLGREALTITGNTQVTVSAPIVQVNSPNVQLGGAGGAAVARVGDSVAGGKITSGSATVTA